jgi:hypothetical protein
MMIVIVDGALAVATCMDLVLSVDHRAIDGALAARWNARDGARTADDVVGLNGMTIRTDVPRLSSKAAAIRGQRPVVSTATEN